MKYRMKPVVVYAIQLSDGQLDPFAEWDDVAEFLGLDTSGRGEHATMRRPAQHQRGNVRVTLHQTLEGSMEAGDGDWIVKGLGDVFFVCKPVVFEAICEPVFANGGFVAAGTVALVGETSH